MTPTVHGFAHTVAIRLRNAAIAGVCGMAAQSGLMAARRWLGILPSFQPYQDLQRLLAEMVGATTAQSLSWMLPMISGALVWSSIFAWAYDRIPANTAIGKGLLVTILAWCLTGFVIMPSLGHGIFAFRTEASIGPPLMMLAMLAAYCLTLSWVYGALGQRPRQDRPRCLRLFINQHGFMGSAAQPIDESGPPAETLADMGEWTLAHLNWEKLLNSQRRKDKAEGKSVERSAKTAEHRTELERDHDRILFSTPVRRMQDKTQVFPLDPHDSVRTRLTHSHEVANMARSFGTALVHVYADQFNLPADLNAERNVPALLEAIGLAHDLGNPPFGHQGEDAIQSWMKAKAPEIFEGLDEGALREDFLKFEGNAQAFRLLTRLQIVNDSYGLNMTYAFLAALMKYPSPSDKVNKKILARKKFNFFQSEADIAKEVWGETGLTEGVRHPLTFVMEACDDIAYSVVDIEDAAKKGLVNFDRLVGYLEHESNGDQCIIDVIERARKQHQKFREQSLSAAELDDITIQMFRVNAIGVMIVAATEAFAANLPSIMAGTFDKELMAASTAERLWRLLTEFARNHIYTHRQVLEVELTGHQTIHGLMEIFWAAIINRKDPGDIASKRTSPLHSYVYSRISENYRRVAESADNRMPIRYRELQLMTDMMSGMTDSFAISLLRDLRARGAT